MVEKKKFQYEIDADFWGKYFYKIAKTKGWPWAINNVLHKDCNEKDCPVNVCLQKRNHNFT